MALGRAGAYSLELATPVLCQTLGAISGESGPLSRAAGLCTQNLSSFVSPVTSLTLLLPTEA